MALSFKVDAEIVGLSVLVGADVAAFLSGLNPSFFTMRAFTEKDGPKAENTRKDIRIGSTIGGGLGILAGFGASMVTGSWWPFLSALVALAIIVGAYEYAISHPHSYSRIAEQ